MTYTIQLRRDDAADWASVNPILHDGEFGWERDTGKFKIGDGTTLWNTLPYTSAVPDDLVEALGDLSDVDLTGAAAGKILGTADGVVWGPVDPPETGGGADPDAMHSSPPLLTYTYDTVEPTAPTDGDIWTDPDDEPPNDLLAAMTSTLVATPPLLITPSGSTLVFSTSPSNKDLRWTPDPARTHLLLKEFRDDADLTGAVRVDGTTPSGAAAQARMPVARGGDSLSVLLDGATSQDAAGELHGWVFPRTGGLAVGEALEMHITYGGLTYNYSFLGPVVADGVAYGAGNQVFFPIWGANYAPNFQDALWTNWNTRGVYTDHPDGSMRMMNFVRIYRSATSTWLYQASSDGKTWITYNTRTLTMTPSHIGLAGGQWGGTGKQVYSIDHMRVSQP